MSKKRGPRRSSLGPADGITAGEVDVVGEQDQLALLEIQPDAAGGVGDHQGGDSQAPQDAYRKGDFFRGISLVGVDAALHDRDRRAGDGADDQAAAVAFHGGLREMGDGRVGNGDRLLDPLRERAQAGAEHDGHPRRDRDALADRGSGLFRSSRKCLSANCFSPVYGIFQVERSAVSFSGAARSRSPPTSGWP